ncbi:COG4315 family predicted lipoprotein [Pontibacter sp. MBLB2868]|uniref:COG4315 family predicted lipoprotein n=1 Tax=Pontibacter sp. MBLB2868 TaxID=3451555 RepID=UPI003F754657
MELTKLLRNSNFTYSLSLTLVCCLSLLFMVACSGENNTSVISKVEPETEEVVANEGARVETRSTEALGAYLTDAEGRSLYIFEGDTAMQSNCYDDCAAAWPPFLSEGTAEAGVGVEAAMLGAIKRKDGSTQVTYNGMPLYYFIKDAEAGQTNGQEKEGFGAEWYLLTPKGEKVHAE